VTTVRLASIWKCFCSLPDTSKELNIKNIVTLLNMCATLPLIMRATLLISQVTQLPATPINPQEEQGLPVFADVLEDRQQLLNSMEELITPLLQTEELLITLAMQTDILAITLLFQTDMLVIILFQTEEQVITLPLHMTDVLVIIHHQLKEEDAITLLHQLKQELTLFLHQLKADWIILLLQHAPSLWQR